MRFKNRKLLVLFTLCLISTILLSTAISKNIPGSIRFDRTILQASTKIDKAAHAVESWQQKLDAPARLIFARTANKKSPHTFSLTAEQKQYAISRTTDGQIRLGVFIEMENGTDPDQLNKVGFIPVSKTENIVSGSILLERLPELAQIPAIRRIETSKMCRLDMDVSRGEMNVDEVHQGRELPQAYKGRGVIVGVVDSGIDFTHPDFSDANGSRILKIIEFTSDFGNYREWSKTDIDNNSAAVTQKDDINELFGHGTHVTGTTAGGGKANSTMTGIAPEADIIFVKVGNHMTEVNIKRACELIFENAARLGKPAVINLSLGSSSGPHDGSSLFEKNLSNLTGPGKVIVASAGNTGNDFTHAGGSVQTDQQYLTVQIPSHPDATGVEIWYDRQVLSQIRIAAYSFDEQNIVLITDWVQVGQSLYQSPVEYNGSTIGILSIDATTMQDQNNGDGYIYIQIDNNNNPGIDVSKYAWFILSLGSGTGRMDMWSLNGYFNPGATGSSGVSEMIGDNERSIGNPGTAEKLVCVGSYVTKNSWTDVNTQYHQWSGLFDENPLPGARSLFSSLGPSRDGRIKPDIVAPGERIAASLSSQLSRGVGYQESDVIQGGYYQLMQGTSMAAPHVTGLVALMLQADPALDYAQVVQVLQETAVKDQNTGASQNNEYGAGKVDALAAMKQVAGSSDAAQAAIDESYLTIYVKPDKTASVPFTVRNIGGATLNFSMTTTDPNLSNALGNHLGLLQVHPQPKPNPSMKIASALPVESQPTAARATNPPLNGATVSATDSLVLDDGNYYPDTFIGWDSKQYGMTWLNEFNVTGHDFLLHGFTFYMRTENANSNITRVAIYDNSFNRIADGNIEYSLAPDGAWFGAVLNEPITVSANERFIIEIESQPGIEYPAGADNDAQITGKSYFMSHDGDLVNMDDYPQFATTAWLIRAFGQFPGSNQPPDAVAWVSKTSVNVNETVIFSASQSSDPDGQIVEYLWNFGDGTTSTQAVATHAYAQAGTRNYSLKVTDNLGATDTATGTISVGSSNLAPVANAVVFPSEAKVGETITFQGSSSFDPDGSIVSYAWNFGDGSSSSSANATHAYSSPGTKNYSLTVVDNNGASGTATGQVMITAEGNRLTVTPENGTIGAGTSKQITASFNAWNMPEGNYQGTIHFTSNGGNIDLPVFIIVSEILAVDSEEKAPTYCNLAQNFPNPFNPETTIGFDLPAAAEVRLHVFDITGRQIQTLENGLVQQGRHQVLWNGRNTANEPVASGIYFYQLTVKPFNGGKAKVFTNRMLLLK